MSSTSYWQATAETGNIPHPEAPPLTGDCATEVAIVGAGVAGTAIALELARAGKEVRVLEGRQIAAGASGRNAGFITSTTGEPYATIVTRLGRDKARRLRAFHSHNDALATTLIAELVERGWSCEYQRDGILRLANSEEELADIQENVTELNHDGWPVTLLTQSELPSRLRQHYLGGLLHLDSGSLHPAKFVRGLALLAQEAGATFHSETPVKAITVDKDGVTLTTPAGNIRARDVVLATNAWLPEIGKLLNAANADWLTRCIQPTRGQVIATESIDERLFPYPCSADHGYQYWRQLADRRLVVGGWRNHSLATENTTDETAGGVVQQQLDAFVHGTLNLPEVRITHRWAGIMAFSADGLPLIGTLPGTLHCYITGGFTGHGNASALQAARIMRELVSGRTHPQAELFDPARFL